MSGVSIIICTRDRAESLRETLASIGRCAVPDLAVELVVVDNGSTDGTAAIVRAAGLANVPVRFRDGKAAFHLPAGTRARTGAGAQRGAARDGFGRGPLHADMCRPILEGRGRTRWPARCMRLGSVSSPEQPGSRPFARLAEDRAHAFVHGHEWLHSRAGD
jgi:glycosyltransferase involved in cell wall biosynthesis